MPGVLEAISRNSPEGLEALEKVQQLKPELNYTPSTKTLIEIVEHYAFGVGVYGINPIGWEASKKRVLAGEKVGRWRIVFHYKDYQKQLLSAEWEFNEATGKLYPFEVRYAPQFWTGGSESKKNKKRDL